MRQRLVVDEEGAQAAAGAHAGADRGSATVTWVPPSRATIVSVAASP